MNLPALLAVTLLATLRVEGPSSCPVAEDVAARLEQLTTGAEASLWLEPRGEELLLELRDLEGRLLAQKRLNADRPCDELAQASALFAAIWLRRLQAGDLPTPEWPVETPDLGGPAAVPLAPAALVPDPPEVEPSAVGPPALASAAPLRSAWRVSVGLSGGLDSAGVAPGLLLGGEVGGESFFGQLELAADTGRELALGPAEVFYRRLSARLGAGHRWRLGARWGLDLRAGLDGSLLKVSGRGFDLDSSGQVFAPGIALGARLARRSARAQPWAGLIGTWWLREVRATAQRVEQRVSTPRWEIALALGVSFGSAE